MGRESLPTPRENTPDDSYHQGRQDVAYKLASYLLVAKSDKKAAIIFSHTQAKRRESKKAALEYLRQERRDPLNCHPRERGDPEARSEKRWIPGLPLPLSPLREQASSFLRSSAGMTKKVELTLSEDQQQQLTTIRQELAVVDQAYLEEKKDNFTAKDRAVILFNAKLSKFNGLSKEEKIEMYRQAGYSEDEILKITGKKLLLSAGLSTGLTFASNGITGAAITHEKIIPFIETIPNNYSGIAVGASLLTYIASYAYITEKDLKLTKKFGGSTNPYVTGVYLAGDKLLSNRARDWFARGLPVGTNAITHAVALPTIVESVTGNPDKIIAGSLAGSAFNVALAATCEIFLRKKKEKISNS